MKRFFCFISILLILGAIACKPKKCKNFADPRNSYHVKYDKKGLVKSKNKNPNVNRGSGKF